ncbi:MAG: hypothetical protein HY074_11920 [Deltaproteobacteria bacterium]|nr:hypothetical protein [Deltaproteobacteria bacterium]
MHTQNPDHRRLFSTRRLRPKRVLLLEDDAYTEVVLGRIFRRIHSSIEVTWIKSVAEAKAKLLCQQFDLIIADIYVEGTETGLDLWHLCERQHADLPFIFISGLPVHEFFNAIGPASIAPPYLPKPLNMDECTQLVSTVLLAESIRRRVV